MTASDPNNPERLLDRRAALGAFGALGVAALGLPSLASAAPARTFVWRLNAVHHAGRGRFTAAVTGCRACRRHARNRIFATAAAAAGGRAHPGCNCTVVRTTVPETTFVALFGPVGHTTRTVVDRRWTWVKNVLISAGTR